ncbi:MAG TPA: hypothetical protein VMT09_11255 [Steroidobacteraceae bacterium]|nr:hypothetical protein [Steroidobacteraceae bacterium]
MPFIIRTIPAPGREEERQTYWLPGPKGYTRTADMNQARDRAFATHAAALAYLESYTKPGVQDEIIEIA